MQKYFEFLFLKIGFSFIFCNVCGGIHKIKIRSANLREEGSCKRCRSNSRKRHLAAIILDAIKSPRRFSSLREIPSNTRVKIYNVESNGALHSYLKHINGYICSEYFGSYEEIGKEKNGILNVDLQQIPFADNLFDFVVSTEVFEHIPNPYIAFKELHRILKPGGSHIFTVPYNYNGNTDEIKAVLNEKNEIIHLTKPEYHGDPIRGEGILVYTIFSKEMISKLEAMNFKVTLNHQRSLKYGILGDENIVFTATKL